MDNYGDYLYRFAFYRTNNELVAEDLVQDTYLSALTWIEKYTGEATEKTWLAAILKNKIIDYYRKASTRNESSLKLSSEQAHSYDYFFDKNNKNHWRDENLPKNWELDANENTAEFYQVIEKCISKLPEKWKGIFKMSVLNSEESKLICKEFGLTTSNFWVIIHRSKLQIRECLEKNWLKL